MIVTVDFNDGTGPHQVLDPRSDPGAGNLQVRLRRVHRPLHRRAPDPHGVVETVEPLPELNLVKQVALPRPGHLTAGDDVTYEFVATNSGGVPITHLHVNDPKVGPVSCPVTVLQPAESTTCTAHYTVTAADVAAGSIDNTAVATGRRSQG